MIAECRNIRKLLQTNIPITIIKFIANYIKGRKTYTTYRNYASIQRPFKIGVPQGGLLSPTLFNIYTAYLPPPRALIQVKFYAYDITITSTHTSTSATNKYIQPYKYKAFAWTKHNHLILNPDKTTCSLFTSDPVEHTSNLDLKKQHCTTHGHAPKGSESYLRPETHIQYTHSQHLSTLAQASTNNKCSHRNRMG